MTTAIILAAGRGTRMGSSIPKQFLEMQGEPIIVKTLRVFDSSPEIDEILLVTSEDYVDYCRHFIIEKYKIQKVTKIIIGGKERYDSVWNALLACEGTDYVMIQDGARPFVTEDILKRTYDTVQKYGTAVVGMPSKDTVKIVDEDGFVSSTPDRRYVWNIQTPQAFSYSLIRRANEIVRERQMDNITDDSMIVEASGLARVRLVEGSYENIKITTPDDLQGR